MATISWVLKHINWHFAGVGKLLRWLVLWRAWLVCTRQIHQRPGKAFCTPMWGLKQPGGDLHQQLVRSLWSLAPAVGWNVQGRSPVVAGQSGQCGRHHSGHQPLPLPLFCITKTPRPWPTYSQHWQQWLQTKHLPYPPQCSCKEKFILVHLMNENELF